MIDFRIALGLLQQNHEKLLRDHYDDRDDVGCDGCQEAFESRQEIELLEKIARGELILGATLQEVKRG